MRSVHGVDDPDPVGLHAGQIVDRLFAEDRITGAGLREPIQDQRVGPPVPFVAEVVRVVKPDLFAHGQQQLTGLLGHCGSQVGVGRVHRLSIDGTRYRCRMGARVAPAHQ